MGVFRMRTVKHLGAWCVCGYVSVCIHTLILIISRDCYSFSNSCICVCAYIYIYIHIYSVYNVYYHFKSSHNFIEEELRHQEVKYLLKDRKSGKAKV